MLNVAIVLVDCITTLFVFAYHKFQELRFNTLLIKNVGVKSVVTKVDLLEKCI